MKGLTYEYAKENKFTAIDLVKYFKPDWTDENCHDYIWEQTCYPFDHEMTISQLNNAFLNTEKTKQVTNSATS